VDKDLVAMLAVIPLGHGRFWIRADLWEDKPVFREWTRMEGLEGRWQVADQDIDGNTVIEVID